MNNTKIIKGGVEKKRALKRAAELSSVASDSKQTNICFSSQSNATNSSDILGRAS